MGFFSKIKSGLQKTRSSISNSVNSIINSFTKIDEELFEELGKNYISGITFSGGDPLYLGSRLDLLELVKEIKEKFPTKTMWLYTGYLWEEICGLELVSYLDVLVDGEFIYEQLDATLKWKGSANQRVIDVQKTLADGEVVLYA